MTAPVLVEVVGTTYARNLRQGDVFIERRPQRGRPAKDDGGIEVFIVNRDAIVEEVGQFPNRREVVKVFVDGYFRARTFSTDERVRLL